MTLQTERLVLRAFTMDDAPRVTELIAVPEVISMLEQPPWPYQLVDAQFWVGGLAERQRSGDAYVFAITTAKDGLIGSIGLQKKNSDLLDLGYWLGTPYWGKGYGGEAALAVMTWAVEALGVQQLESGYFEDNPASGSILSKLGFVPTGCSCQIKNALRSEPVACLGMVWNA